MCCSSMLENTHTNVLERLRNYVTARDVIIIIVVVEKCLTTAARNCIGVDS